MAQCSERGCSSLPRLGSKRFSVRALNNTSRRSGGGEGERDPGKRCRARRSGICREASGSCPGFGLIQSSDAIECREGGEAGGLTGGAAAAKWVGNGNRRPSEVRDSSNPTEGARGVGCLVRARGFTPSCGRVSGLVCRWKEGEGACQSLVAAGRAAVVVPSEGMRLVGVPRRAGTRYVGIGCVSLATLSSGRLLASSIVISLSYPDSSGPSPSAMTCLRKTR